MQNQYLKNGSMIFMVVWMLNGCYQDSGRQVQEASPALKLESNSRSMPSDDKARFEGSATGESLSKFGDAANVIRAEIVSVDEPNQEVIIKDIATGNQIKTRVADPSTLGSFVPGDRVRVTFASSDTNTATSVVAEENWKN
jgi:hypothetical protein